MNISLIGNSALRIAIQRNLVSFPSQIPAFMKRPGDDTQQRIAHLYFSRGWQIRNICARYGLSKAMVQRLVSEWRIRAIGAGYIQDIHPEDLDVLMHLKDESDLPLSAEGHGAHVNGTHHQDVQLLPPAIEVQFFHTRM